MLASSKRGRGAYLAFPSTPGSDWNTALHATRRTISSGVNPNSLNTHSVCSPTRGAALEAICERLSNNTGSPRVWVFPPSGASTSCTMPTARDCSCSSACATFSWDGTCRHPGFLKPLDPVRHGRRVQCGVYEEFQFASIPQTRIGRVETWIALPLGVAQQIRNAFPVRLIGAADAIPPSAHWNTWYGAIRAWAVPDGLPMIPFEK